MEEEEGGAEGKGPAVDSSEGSPSHNPNPNNNNVMMKKKSEEKEGASNSLLRELLSLVPHPERVRDILGMSISLYLISLNLSLSYLSQSLSLCFFSFRMCLRMCMCISVYV